MPVTEDTNTNSHPETECTPDVRLSRRELEVLSLIAEGRSTREIAAALWVTEETIKSHVSRVLRRLEARTRAHAVAIAYRDGLWANGRRRREEAHRVGEPPSRVRAVAARRAATVGRLRRVVAARLVRERSQDVDRDREDDRRVVRRADLEQRLQVPQLHRDRLLRP